MIDAVQDADATKRSIATSDSEIPPRAVKVRKLDVEIIHYLKATHTDLYTKLRVAVLSAIKRS